MNIPSLDHCLDGLERSHILFDTNFLIDAIRSINREESHSPYIAFTKSLKEKEITRTTIQPVTLEFFKGTDLLIERRKKKETLDELIDVILPLDTQVFELSDELVQLYRTSGKNIDVTDFLIGATLMKYRTSNFYLLSRDHDDFPVKIFDRERVIVLQEPRGGVYSYGLFKFSSNKAEEIQNSLLEVDQRSN